MFKVDDIVVCTDVTTDFASIPNGASCWREKLSVGDIGKVCEVYASSNSIKFERCPLGFQILDKVFRHATPEEQAVYKNGQTNVGNGIGTKRSDFNTGDIVICTNVTDRIGIGCSDPGYRRHLGVGQICEVTEVDKSGAIRVRENYSTGNYWMTSEAFSLATSQEKEYYKKHYSTVPGSSLWTKDVSTGKLLKKCDFTDFKEGMAIRVKNSSGNFEGIAYKESGAWYCATSNAIGAGGNTLPDRYKKDYQYSWSISSIHSQGCDWGHSTIEVTILSHFAPVPVEVKEHPFKFKAGDLVSIPTQKTYGDPFSSFKDYIKDYKLPYLIVSSIERNGTIALHRDDKGNCPSNCFYPADLLPYYRINTEDLKETAEESYIAYVDRIKEEVSPIPTTTHWEPIAGAEETKTSYPSKTLKGQSMDKNAKFTTLLIIS